MNGVLENGGRQRFAVGTIRSHLRPTIYAPSSGVIWSQQWRQTSGRGCSGPWCELCHLWSIPLLIMRSGRKQEPRTRWVVGVGVGQWAWQSRWRSGQRKHWLGVLAKLMMMMTNSIDWLPVDNQYIYLFHYQKPMGCIYARSIGILLELLECIWSYTQTMTPYSSSIAAYLCVGAFI